MILHVGGDDFTGTVRGGTWSSGRRVEAESEPNGGVEGRAVQTKKARPETSTWDDTERGSLCADFGEFLNAFFIAAYCGVIEILPKI